MEVWGDAILKASGRNWSGIKGGRRARLSSSDGQQSMHLINKGNQPKGDHPSNDGGRAQYALKEGDPINLDKKRFTNYTATLRAFARALADGVTNLPDVKKGA
ncbi:hypothetical protein ACLJYM_25000 [Rhizobium giardinii]|uniref:hypothetical protein n=1 Tax=Rhizobium giardinii TaxID=56731 RepID=UPI0013AFD962